MLRLTRISFLATRLASLFFVASVMICLYALICLFLSPAPSWSLPNTPQQQPLLYPQAGHKGWYADPAVPSEDCHEKDRWNILYHLGGNGPWIEKVDGVVEGGIAVPEGCSVDMVHMMSRHGERYPTESAGARMQQLLERVSQSGIELRGSLDFLNTWTYFTTTPSADLEQLTSTGPYAGILQAFSTGVKLSTRYRHLTNGSTTHIWASDSTRVVDTARYFSAGFFGLSSTATKLIVVPEDADRGGNTLTPGDTCLLYRNDTERGHDYGYDMLYKYRDTYLPAIAARLESENPGLNFTNEEIYSMQELCGFETLVRGSSDWCEVFTHPEWEAFEYARDVIHYYRTGPGNPYSRAMGWLWLNATTNLLLEGPETAGGLYFSFVHDGDIVPMISALGLFEDAHDIPTTHIDPSRKWKTSQITPMGGRVLFERLTCKKELFVRFNVNDGIVALQGCDTGPGGSCPLREFAAYVKRRGEMAGDFRRVCGLDENAPERLEFLRQPGM